MTGRRVFYGWRIVGAGFGLEVLIGALLFHAYGAYVVLMREEFGWSRTLFSAVFAMARAESAVLGPVQGWLTDRFGPRALMRVGMTIFGLGFVLFSRIDSPLEFFGAFFLVAVGAGLGGYVPIAVAIVNWFKRRRALALGLASSGSAVGGLLTPVVVASLTTLGWRGTALLSGVLVLVVGLLAAQVFRHRPEHYGEYPDGLPPGDTGPSSPSNGSVVASVDFTPREAMRTAAFWLVSLGHGAALLVVSAVIVHMVTHVTERLGYSLAQAASVVALLTVAQIGGHLGGGWAGDRASKRVIAAGCMVGHAVALLLLAWASAYWMVIAFAGLHGLVLGHARAPDGGHPRRLLRGGGVRDHLRRLVDGHDAGHDGRAPGGRDPGRPHGKLWPGLYRARSPRAPRLRLLPAREAAAAAGARACCLARALPR